MLHLKIQLLIFQLCDNNIDLFSFASHIIITLSLFTIAKVFFFCFTFCIGLVYSSGPLFCIAPLIAIALPTIKIAIVVAISLILRQKQKVKENLQSNNFIQSNEKKQQTYNKNDAKKIYSNNFTRSNKEISNIAIATL